MKNLSGMRFGLLCALLIGACLSGAVPVARADDAAVTLARTYKEGVTLRYRVNTRATVGDSESTLTTKTTVKEVKKNGDVVLIVTSEDGKYTFNGAEGDIPPAPPITQVHDKSGKLTEYKQEMVGRSFLSFDVAHLIAIADHVMLPDRPVKAGDTWQTERTNPAVEGKKITLKGKFYGIEKVDKAALWKVGQTTEMDTEANGAKISMEVLAWLDPADGHLIKLESKAADVPTPFGALGWTTTMAQIKPDVPERSDKEKPKEEKAGKDSSDKGKPDRKEAR